jgi:hypothetical protein
MICLKFALSTPGRHVIDVHLIGVYYGRVPISVYLIGLHLIGVYLMGMYLTGLHPIGAYLMGIQPMGMHLTDVYLMGIYLIGMYVMGVHLTGMRLMGMHLMGRASHRHVLHRHTPHRHASCGRVLIDLHLVGMCPVERSRQVCIEWVEATVLLSIYLSSELILIDTKGPIGQVSFS